MFEAFKDIVRTLYLILPLLVLTVLEVAARLLPPTQEFQIAFLKDMAVGVVNRPRMATLKTLCLLVYQ